MYIRTGFIFYLCYLYYFIACAYYICRVAGTCSRIPSEVIYGNDIDPCVLVIPMYTKTIVKILKKNNKCYVIHTTMICY